jgi:hypothetical protein
VIAHEPIRARGEPDDGILGGDVLVLPVPLA